MIPSCRAGLISDDNFDSLALAVVQEMAVLLKLFIPNFTVVIERRVAVDAAVVFLTDVTLE